MARLNWIIGILACLGAFAPVASCAEPSGELVFFAFDDYAIPWHHNTKVTLQHAQKYSGNPVLRHGTKGAPDEGHAVLYGTVIRDGNKFRMWYLRMFETELKQGQAPGWWRPMCYAESADGMHWSKPDLGLVEFHGNKHNNICLIEGDPFSLTRVDDYLCVLDEPQDPDPARRYKSAYIAHVPFGEVKGGRSAIGPNERRWCSFICATSADGLKWKVVGDRPMNAGGERFEVSGLYHFGDFYYASGQRISPWAFQRDGRDIGRVMLTYRSGDFLHWSAAKAQAFARVGQTIAQPIPGQQTHMGAGIWNRGNVLVGLYGMWQDAPAPPPKGASHLLGTHIDLGLIVSNDGIHFREPVPDFKVIARGKEGEWDNIALLQGHAFANVGDQTMIWYSHWDTGGTFQSMDIGLATLRRDGFGCLSRNTAGVEAQSITSDIPAAPGGYRLKVNVDGVSAQTPLIVELLDKLGRPLPEFSGANAARISEPGTAVEVKWPRGGSAPSPSNEPFAIQVGFAATGDARLFAIYADPVP